MNATVPLIGSQAELEALFTRLRGAPLLAVDTEAASFHRFTDRVYLLQISSRDETAIVDPLAVESLAPLAEVLADPAVEVVFHDADYDLRLIDREYGYRAANLFDTRIAAQLLNEPGVGLAALLEKYLGVRLDKRFQRADWSARPLSPPMLEYAAADTRHLALLRDILRGQLEARGRLAWAQEEFALLEDIRWSPPNGEPGWLRLKGAKALKPRELAILRELFEWREGLAQRSDRATFRILNNEPMVTWPNIRLRTWPHSRRSRASAASRQSAAARTFWRRSSAVSRFRMRSCRTSNAQRGGPTIRPSKRDLNDSRPPATVSPSSSTWRLECSAPTARSRPSPAPMRPRSRH